MQSNLLEEIELAYKNRDLSVLDALAVPRFREINKKQNFASVLMLSCNKIKNLSKIQSLEADCIMLNL